MTSKVYSACLQGLFAQIIEVEVAASKGLRSFIIVGLPDKSVEEAKERTGAAIKSINLSPPHHQAKRVLVNLAPADLKKKGSLYDLPIALGYLLASGQIKFNPEKKIIMGELALDGSLRPTNGSLSFALLARDKGFEEIILPKENAPEAALVNQNSSSQIKVVGLENLKEAIAYLEKRKEIPGFEINLDKDSFEKEEDFEINISWIKGQEYAKRALEISAAGGHNLFMQGPPGTGKTLLAKSIISILPKLNFEESLELTKIYSAAGLLPKEKAFLRTRPFRAPHHISSEVALMGGGNPPRPGEITLAHRGILFLDEFPEFHRDVLESLRQPLEEGKITISRANNSFTFPASFSLIAASNPCPCGYLNDPERECTCIPSQINSYRRKLSGPLMDRIDIFVDVPSLKYEKLVSPDKKSLTFEIRERVKKAREIQEERFKEEKILLNSQMNIPQIKKYCPLDSASQNFLRKFVDSAQLSARGFHRVLKTARTIADLEEKENILFSHITEGVFYRLREEK
ncbi:magnesium chelatase [bacterium (Candidatus Gribaldobacteria) CG_4_10_14_0_2_um_filter_36_18]|uniref:Magnesium chelatase n=1 Tax=bacterium (Candidatus Gribaldobacteria) CG_4_10_14_0_2_um_filter_36_18 TaxID=2014264 RepID=A0A2M7VK12_9BACT|nr:MAG: magnesium chelatase [bacterium (Candidatus Gribaldobacteria) CG_4_10_14_0_2_um_filter_36_18]